MTDIRCYGRQFREILGTVEESNNTKEQILTIMDALINIVEKALCL